MLGEPLLIFLLFVGFFAFAVGRENRNVDPPERETQAPLPEEQRALPTAIAVGEKPQYAAPKAAEPASAVLVLSGPAWVIDGDSLTIRGTEIRLFGVDAPEMKHPHGRTAKFKLIDLCRGQTVRVEIDHVDHYGRTVARCLLPDGRDLSEEMVKAGLAIDWPKFSKGRYKEFEVEGVRRKLWLADARQNGRIHVWEEFHATQVRRAAVRR